MQEDVGNTLKAIRLEKRFSQRKLAQLAGVTNGHISKIEKNQSDVSVCVLIKITNALGVSMSDFFERAKTVSN